MSVHRQVSAIVEHYFDVDVTEAQRSLNAAGEPWHCKIERAGSDELLNGDIKRTVGQVRPRDRDALKAATRKWLHPRQKHNAMTNRHDYPNSPDGTCKALTVI
jgi:hypothetical protein